MSASAAFGVVRSWMATKLGVPKAVIDALERYIGDKAVSFREMADLAAHSVIGRDSATAGQPQAVSITGGLEFTGSASIQRSALTGDVTASAGSGATTIAAHAVTNPKFRQSAGLSLVGNSTNATADVADITAASDGQVMRRSGTAIAFGAVNLASANAVTGALPFGNGGTGQTAYTDGQLLIGNTSTGGLSKSTLTAGSNVTITNAGGTITIAASGGTGTVSSVTSATGDLTVATGTTTPVLTVVSAPKWTTGRTLSLTGDVTCTSPSLDGSGDVTAAATIASNAVTTAKINAGAVTEAKITLANNTTNNVSTSAHGFAPILPNDATKYLDGTGAYSVPAGGGGGGSGSLAYLATVTVANGASINVTTRNQGSFSGAIFQSDYDVYEVHFVDVLNVTNSVNIYLRVSTNGGSTYDSAANYTDNSTVAGSGVSVFNTTTGTQFTLNFTPTTTVANNLTYALEGSLKFFNPAGTTNFKTVIGQVSYPVSGQLVQYWPHGVYRVSASAVNAFQVLASSGNISGTVRVYGVVK